jgi:dephospho-CoA kinase
MRDQMFEGKPIIGIAGGIGSGKSLVASVLREENCAVISSDEQVKNAYKDSTIKMTLQKWWGNLVLDPSGEIDRGVVAGKIFNSPAERQRLENLIHPVVNKIREKQMKQAANDPRILAYVWDTPLLFETGLNTHCDTVIFVDSAIETRISRVRESRGWAEGELEKRENVQMPLDKKREASEYVVANTADAEELRRQVREVLSRILAGALPQPK